MPHKAIPSSTLAAGASFSRHLVETMRGNRLYVDHVVQMNVSQMDAATGHAHGLAETTDYSYTFGDRIAIVSGANDRLDFKYAGGSKALATYAAVLTAGIYTPATLAAHVQAQMRSIAGAITDIDVSYHGPTDPAPGFIVIQHSGLSDSPEPRVFQLLCASGVNGPTGTDRSTFPAIGYAMGKDRTGAFGYVGDSGLFDGYTQDDFPAVGDGGQIDTAGIADQAFNEASFTTNILDGTHIKALSVTGAKIGTGAITGDKSSAPIHANAPLILPIGGPGGTLTFDMGTVGRIPSVCIAATGAAGTAAYFPRFVYQTAAPTHTVGGTYTVPFKNDGGTTVTLDGWAY